MIYIFIIGVRSHAGLLDGGPVLEPFLVSEVEFLLIVE